MQQLTEQQKHKLRGLYYLALSGDPQFAPDCALLSERPAEQFCPERHRFFTSPKGFGCCELVPQERLATLEEAVKFVQPMSKDRIRDLVRELGKRGSLKQANALSDPDLYNFVAALILAHSWSREDLQRRQLAYLEERKQEEKLAAENRAAGQVRAAETRKRNREEKERRQQWEQQQQVAKRQRIEQGQQVLARASAQLMPGQPIPLTAITVAGWVIGPSGETERTEYNYRDVPSVLVARTADATGLQVRLTTEQSFVLPEMQLNPIVIPANTVLELQFDPETSGVWRGRYDDVPNPGPGASRSELHRYRVQLIGNYRKVDFAFTLR